MRAILVECGRIPADAVTIPTSAFDDLPDAASTRRRVRTLRTAREKTLRMICGRLRRLDVPARAAVASLLGSRPPPFPRQLMALDLADALARHAWRGLGLDDPDEFDFVLSRATVTREAAGEPLSRALARRAREMYDFSAPALQALRDARQRSRQKALIRAGSWLYRQAIRGETVTAIARRDGVTRQAVQIGLRTARQLLALGGPDPPQVTPPPERSPFACVQVKGTPVARPTSCGEFG